MVEEGRDELIREGTDPKVGRSGHAPPVRLVFSGEEGGPGQSAVRGSRTTMIPTTSAGVAAPLTGERWSPTFSPR